MTLDEAIKHAEEVADVCEFEASKYDMTDAYESHVACQEGKCAEEHRQLAEWLKELKQLRDQTRWIPVSDRLPNNHEYIKNNGLFNVSDGNRSYFDWFDIYNTEKFVKPTIAGFRVDNAVTAWMPLPKPYKEESEAEK